MSIDPTLPSSLTTGMPALNQQLDRIRAGFAIANTSEGEARRHELKKATQEFEAVFVNYMLKVMRSTVESADEESNALGKDVYMSMFDQEIALDIAKNHSLGIGEMLFRQLESTVKTEANKASRVLSESRRSTDVLQPHQSEPFESDLSQLSPKTGSPISLAMPASNEQQPPGSKAPDLSQPDDWLTPVEGRLSSHFGPRFDPLTQSARLHRGIDIAAPAGTPIRAAQSGTVVFSGYLTGYGNTIILEHANGFRTLYGHASKNLVSDGQPVSTQQIIGEVGRSGRSTGTHLHFELQKGGERIDPHNFLQASNEPAWD